SKSYTIQSITDNNANEAIKYEYADSINKVIDAKASLDVLVKVSYVSAVDDITNRSQLDNTRLSFVLSSEDGEVKGDVEVNPTPGPKTGDSIYFYIALSSISLIGLIVLVKVPKKKTYMVLLLLITPIIVKALSITFITSFNNNIQFLDKLVVKINNNGTVTQQTINYKSTISEPIPTEKDGYNFIGWFSGNTEFDFDAPITGDVNVEGKYEIIPYTISYELNGGTADTVNTYNVETETITLPQPTKQGYDFTGWTGSNGETPELTVTIDKGSTGDKSYVANYTARTDTPYKVVHKYETLTGEYDEIEYPETGTTDTNVTPAVISKTGYDDPNTQTVNIDATGDTVITYEYKLKRLTFTVSDRTYLTNNSSANGTYRYGETISLQAVERQDYLFRWSDDDTNYQKSFVITANTQLSLIYTYNKYVVTFNAQNGTCSEETRLIIKGSEIGNLPTCTPPDYYEFVEWQDGNKNVITSSYVPTDDIELTAIYRSTDKVVTFDTIGGSAVSVAVLHQNEAMGTLPTSTKDDKVFAGWYLNTNYAKEDKITSEYVPTDSMIVYAKWDDYLCVKATQIHSDVCKGTNTSQGCRGAGMAVDQEYTYGNIISSDTLVVGDALDCNVDGTGYNHRFYYLYNKDGNAVLISYNNYQEDNGVRGPGNTKNYTYSVAENYLPTTTEWPNVNVTFDDKASRYLDMDDLTQFTGKTTGQLTSSKVLDPYIFLFENTSYTTLNPRSTYWIKDWVYNDTTLRGRIHKNSRQVVEIPSDQFETNVNSVRPVIEVPTEYINDQYVVKFDYQVGSEYVRVKKGASLGTLPTPTNGTSVIDGWYTTDSYQTKINAETVPIGYVTYYAKWVKSVSDVTLQQDTFMIQAGSTDNIVMNYTGELEEYTLTSNNENIVTVSQDGTITAQGAGTTTITLQGLKSNATVTINVTVVLTSTNVTVVFNTQGGSAVVDASVPKNTTIGTLPTTELSDNIFDGWYTDTTYTEKVTEETIIVDDTTFFARWIPENAVAEANGQFFTSLSTAMTNANPNSTVKILKDISSIPNIDIKKDLTIDLNKHTIASTGRAFQVFANVEIKNGTITTNGGSGAIDVVANDTYHGKLIMNSGKIIATGTRQAIYISGGDLEFGGNAFASAKADGSNAQHRATIHLVSGTATITGGEIVSDKSSNSYGISVNDGTLVIGTKDGRYDKDAVKIMANTNGIISDVEYSIYDGTVIGKINPTNNESLITGTEDGATKVTEVDEYPMLYYTMTITQHLINLDPNGGTVDYNVILVDMGSAINDLPTPTRGKYTFAGWYDENEQLVTTATVPTGDMNLTARWTYTSNDNIQTFNMTNEVMSEYFDKISTWKSNQSTLQASMYENFNAYNCKCNEKTCNTAGTELCDKPLGYQTADDNVTVYLSNETTKVKGDEATYVTVKDGKIYNMIPGETYYWESNTDSTVYGYVKAEGTRRIIDVDGVRNVRDLGGLRVDLDKDGNPDGTLKYGRLFRGEKIWNDSNNVTQLRKLGINEEVDLRSASERSNGEVKFNDNFKQREIIHYQLNFETQRTNYDLARNTVIEVMQDIIEEKENPNVIYFHCRIGTDRTGTLAYILEGLLGVMQEDMLEDYELSYFFGLVNRHRYYSYDASSSDSKDKKFVYMYNIMSNADEVYEWFMLGSTDQDADNALIAAFRQAMIK
ncbi:MAG: InlB B-repeat-containing protein, partial [Bacilli bacterium]|nr:InlB B-repeat-containing protein [Bacilli bacterium]